MKTFKSFVIYGIIGFNLVILSPQNSNAIVNPAPLNILAQQDLLGEYESKLTITDKKISEIKGAITEAQMSNMDVKLKLGEVENSRNRIYFLIDTIKKKSGKAAQTEYDALKKEFEMNQQLIDQLTDLL